MVNRVGACFAACLLALPFAARPSEWVYLGATTDSKSTIMIDADSIREESPLVRVWVRWHHSTPQAMRKDKRKFQASKERYAVSCSGGSYRMESEILYSDINASKDVVSSNAWQGGALEPAAPDTIAESIIRYACEAEFRSNTNFAWRKQVGYQNARYKRVRNVADCPDLAGHHEGCVEWIEQECRRTQTCWQEAPLAPPN